MLRRKPKQKKKKPILSKKRPQKRFLLPLKKKAGKNNTGRITVRHKGGGVKRLYRLINFGQVKMNETAQVEAIEYDPNRTCFITLLHYNDGYKCYVLAADGLKVGDSIVCAEKAELKIGNRLKLKYIPVGTMVYNIELQPGRGGQMARVAGSAAQVMAQEEKYTNLKMPSSEVRKVLGECFCSVGNLSNPEHRFHQLGKAGISRLRGIRPSVRGSAMNACDHPHGGGKNAQPIGLKYPKTPWGKHALGVKTRGRKQSDRLILQRRSK
jgi:large subunit ribosomal protein L2